MQKETKRERNEQRESNKGQMWRVIERQRAEETVGGQSRREYGGGEEEREGAYVNHSFTSYGLTLRHSAEGRHSNVPVETVLYAFEL